jgi:hypothetical protein
MNRLTRGSYEYAVIADEEAQAVCQEFETPGVTGGELYRRFFDSTKLPKTGTAMKIRQAVRQRLEKKLKAAGLKPTPPEPDSDSE